MQVAWCTVMQFEDLHMPVFFPQQNIIPLTSTNGHLLPECSLRMGIYQITRQEP